jgi:hypothetical protein
VGVVNRMAAQPVRSSMAGGSKLPQEDHGPRMMGRYAPRPIPLSLDAHERLEARDLARQARRVGGVHDR